VRVLRPCRSLLVHGGRVVRRSGPLLLRHRRPPHFGPPSRRAPHPEAGPCTPRPVPAC
jgi:hypothetical protein